MAEFVSIDKLKVLISDYFKDFKPDTPIYKIGDTVKTKGDIPQSYISKVIGAGKQGTVVSNCSIPLVDFGKRVGQFYICQNKLKSE